MTPGRKPWGETGLRVILVIGEPALAEVTEAIRERTVLLLCEKCGVYSFPEGHCGYCMAPQPGVLPLEAQEP